MLKKFIIGEFSNWHFLEWCWMLFCTASTIYISHNLGDNAFGMAAAVTGVLYSLWAGKGKLSCYFFGIFNSAAYGWISFQAGLYGEVALNWGWYFPMMFAGLFFWKRNLKEDVQEIVKTRLTSRARLIYGLITAAAVAAGAGILALLRDPMPVVDSITTVLSVAAMILTVKRCSEQWFLWTVVNVVSIYMWYRVYQTGEGSAAVLMMWILSLINGIMFYCLWQREIKKCAKKI